LRPPGYDAEVVYLVALLQSLGRLVTHYHFAEEAAQIERLMQPVEAEQEGERDEPGMSEESASLAVLGVDIDALGAAVARYWGLDESVLHMARRFALTTAVRAIESDDDMLRATASCANELVDALHLPARQIAAGMQRVAQRYARALNVTLRDLQQVAQGQAPHDDDDERDGPHSTRHAA
jgi:non-specific serine/threonine protein kinase